MFSSVPYEENDLDTAPHRNYHIPHLQVTSKATYTLNGNGTHMNIVPAISDVLPSPRTSSSITLTSIFVRYTINRPPTTISAYNAVRAESIRILVVLDTEFAGVRTLPNQETYHTGATVFPGQDGFYSLRKHDSRGRYKILYDKVHDLDLNTVLVQQSAGTYFHPSKVISGHIKIPNCLLPMQFLTSAGLPADQTGSVPYIVVTSTFYATTTTFTFNSSLLFIDQ